MTTKLDFSSTEIENMIPFERDVYMGLYQAQKEEEERNS